MDKLVKVKGNQVVTSSRDVAKDFNKEHRHVRRDVRDIIESGCDQNWTHLFYESTYVDSMNRPQKEILMNRDGFTLLAMGFTGKKALEWKLKYIDAFNRMEKELMMKKDSYMIEDPVQRAEAWIVEYQEKEQLKALVNNQSQIIGELKPRADYTDTILRSNSLMTITQIAKDYDMTGNEMNKLLHTLGVQYKQSGQWLLYKEHHGKGYTKSETYVTEGFGGIPVVTMSTKWKQKGRLFIYNLLKENNVMPMIETI